MMYKVPISSATSFALPILNHSDRFEKTTKTFSDILQRLALIDDAQKKITELSTNVVSLQEVLNDKRSRGAFGEVQLNSLIRNVLPEQSFKLQHTLSNGKIADCVLFLPKPTGNVVVDSKFPLESYRKMMDFDVAEQDRKSALRQFKVDIKKHIKNIIDNEDKSNPLIDEALTKILLDKDYIIARRTVTKYREVMKIPAARLRRK